MKLNIDLKAENGPATIGSANAEEYFPEFTFRHDDEPDFPETGTMVISYRKVRSSVDKKNKSQPYSCTIEVREIVSAKGEKGPSAPSEKYDEAGSALDKLAKQKMDARDKEEAAEGESD